MDGGAVEMGPSLSPDDSAASPPMMERPLLDVVDDAQVAAKSGNVRAAVNQIKAIVGVGILSFPYGFRQAGVVLGAVFLLAMGVLVNYTMQLLVAVKVDVNRGGRAPPATTYEAIASTVLGRWGGVAATVAVMGTQVGISCAYVLFVATELHSLVPALAVPLWALLLTPAIFALCTIRNIRNLAPLSAFAIAAILVSVATVFYYGFTVQGLHAPPLWPTNFFLFYGTAIFAFEGINLAIPVHENMSTPHDYGFVLTLAFVAIGAIYMAFGVFGVAFFGADAQPIVTLNLPSNWVVTVVKIALITEVLLTYPVQIFPAILFLEHAILGAPEETSFAAWRTALFWKRNAVRLALVCCTVAIAVAVPMFHVVTNLVGGLGNGTAGFVLPALMHLVLFGARVPRWRRALHWAIVVFGTLTAVLVTVFSVIEFVEKFGSVRRALWA